MNPKAKWDRPTLKEYAKTALKSYYWWAVLASLIVAVLTGGFANSDGGGITIKLENNELVMPSLQQNFFPGIRPISGAAVSLIAVLAGLVALVALALGFTYTAFISNPLQVGHNRFYMENRFKGGNAPAGNIISLLHGFSGGNYWNVVKIMFFRDLYIFLWSLLFVIPGIVKAYEYRMVPYILAENPNIPKERAFELSKQMMDGRKWDALVFDFSFLGWRILASFLIIGHVFLNPYIEASCAEMYLWLRYDALYNNYAHPQELNGLFMESDEYRQY